MSIAPLNPQTPNLIGIRALNVRTANGTTDTTPAGALIPAGTVLVSFTPCYWNGNTYIADLPSVTISDVGAWLAALAGAGNSLATEAATMFATAQADLLWLMQLILSQQSPAPCAAPGS